MYLYVSLLHGKEREAMREKQSQPRVTDRTLMMHSYRIWAFDIISVIEPNHNIASPVHWRSLSFPDHPKVRVTLNISLYWYASKDVRGKLYQQAAE